MTQTIRARSSPAALACESQNSWRRVLRYMLDETEFLSPHGIRAFRSSTRITPMKCTSNGQDISR